MNGVLELNGEDGSGAHSLAGPVGFEPTTYGLGDRDSMSVE